MTLKEKVAEMMPEAIGNDYVGGVDGCPKNYDFLNATDLCTYCSGVDRSLCEKCWNREFIEENKPKMTIDGMIKRLEDNPCMCDGASDSNCNKCMQNNLQLVEYLKELDCLRVKYKEIDELFDYVRKRLEHLLESDYIALFDEIDQKTGEYIHDIKKAGLSVGGLNKGGSKVYKLNGNAVDHPTHYQGKHECIEVMRAIFGDEMVKGFCMCNAYKYRFRTDKKNGAEDIEKAEWYEDYLIKMLKEEKDND